MIKNPKETLLSITAMAGYLDYTDATRLFNSISNRNRVIKECKASGFISVSSSKGLRTIHLLSAGKSYVREKYPDLPIFEFHTGDLEAKKRRCVIGKVLTTMAKMDIPLGEQKEGCYFKLKMDGASEDRGGRLGRMVGIFSAPDLDYMTYQLSDAGIRWNDRREASQAALIHTKRQKEVGMLILADGLNALTEILANTDLSESEKSFRKSKGTLRIHLGESRRNAYFIWTRDLLVASMELSILSDLETKEMLKEVFERDEEEVLIPVDLRKLYGLYKDPHKKTVYVLERYCEHLKELLSKHEIIGVPADGLWEVIKKEG